MVEEEIMQVRRSLNEMMQRTQEALAKFVVGSSQHSLLKNRLHALRVGLCLLEEGEKDCTREDMEQAVAPVNSLIQKSGKAREKVKQGSWQHGMLSNNLHALAMVKDKLERVLNTVTNGNTSLTPGVDR